MSKSVSKLCVRLFGAIFAGPGSQSPADFEKCGVAGVALPSDSRRLWPIEAARWQWGGAVVVHPKRHFNLGDEISMSHRLACPLAFSKP